MSNLKEVRSKTTKITLSDGVEREVKFTLNAMAELEDRYGSIDAAFEALNKGSIKAVRCVLWASMLCNDSNLTEQQVGNLIDVDNMEDIMNSMNAAFETSMPENKALPNVEKPVVVLPAQ